MSKPERPQPQISFALLAGMIFAGGLTLAIGRIALASRSSSGKVGARWVMTDFFSSAYYPVRALLEGGNPHNRTWFLDHYPVSDMYGPFLPVNLLINLPFGLMAPDAAAFLYFWVTVLLIVLLAVLSFRLARIPVTVSNTVLVAGLILLSRPGHWNLLLGQSVVLLSCLAYLALDNARRSPIGSGFALALAAFKPTFGVPLGLLMLARRDVRAVAAAVVISLVLNLPLLWLLASRAGGLHQFIATALDGIKQWQALPRMDPAFNHHQIDAAALIGRFLGHSPSVAAGALLGVGLILLAAFAVRKLGDDDPADRALSFGPRLHDGGALHPPCGLRFGDSHRAVDRPRCARSSASDPRGGSVDPSSDVRYPRGQLGHYRCRGRFPATRPRLLAAARLDQRILPRHPVCRLRRPGVPCIGGLQADAHDAPKRAAHLSLESPRERSGPAAIPVGLLAITAVGAALRFWRLAQNSLWTDEIASLLTASERFWTIPHAALRQDAFEPPLYFWLLHLTAASFGVGETALRFPSAIAGALTIPLVWLLVWELSRQRQMAMLSATFLALNPMHLWYSQEARPYAFMVFLGTAALLALARTLRQPSLWQWALFVACSSLALLMHAVAAVVPIIALAWVLLRPDRASKLRPLLLAFAATMLLVAPSYIMLARAIIHATGTGSPERPLTGLELPYTALTYLAGYSFGPSVREIQDSGWQVAAAHHVVQLGLTAMLLVLWLALVAVRRSNLMISLLVLCMLPAVLAFVGSAATTKAYNVRYAVLGVVGFVASLSVAIVPLRPSLRNAVAAIFCTIFVWADLQWFIAPRYWKDDSRAAIAWLSARVPPGTRVAVAPSYAIAALAHYSDRSRAHLCLLGVATEADLTRDGIPDALVLTRLHHVENWQALEAAFARSSGSSLERGEEIGFRLFVRASPGAPRSSSPPPGC